MSNVIDKVREKYSEYKDVPEDELVLRIGSKFPAYLDQDSEFKTEFQGVVADRAMKLVKGGITDLLGVLGNPAVGEAAQMGREQSAEERKPLEFAKPRMPATGEMSTTYGGGRKPLATFKETIAEPMEELSNPRITGQIKIDSKDNPALVVGKEAANIALGIPEFFSSDLGVSSAVASVGAPVVTAGAFTADMLHSLGTQIRDTYKNWDKLSRNEKIKAITDIGGTGLFSLLTGHSTVRGARGLRPITQPIIDQIEKSGAPLTAAAVKEQITRDPSRPTGPTFQRPTGPVDPARPVLLDPSRPAGPTFDRPAGPTHEPAKAPAEPERPTLTDPERPTGPEHIRPDQPEHLPTGAIEGTSPPLAPGQAVSGLLPGLAAASHATSAPPSPEKPQEPVKAAQSAPSWQVTAASYTDPKTGKTTTGENHIKAAAEQGKKAPKIPTNRHGEQYGFEVIDPETGEKRIVSRDEAEVIARGNGQLLREPERGKLHSDEVEFYKPEEKGKEDAVQPETAQPVQPLRDTSREGAGQVPIEGTVPKDDEGRGEEAPKLEASQEQKEVKTPRIAQAQSSTKRFHAETELNGPDVLSWMEENMKMLSKRAARLKWGREKFRQNQSLYDDSVPLQRPHHNLVYSEKGESPDVVAQHAYEAGLLKEPSVNELFSAMDKASKARGNAFKTAKREESFMAEESKQHTDWLSATKEGEHRISGDQLKVGDKLEVDGEQVEVTKVDPDTGDATLKDGRKFGTQTVSEGQTIHVQKFEESPEGEAGFGAEEEAAPQAAVPKLGAMEKGTGDLLKGVEEDFSLTGEKGTDAERIAAEKTKAAKTAEEAKAIEAKQQHDFFGRPEPFTQTKEEFAEESPRGEAPPEDFHEASVQAAVANDQPVPPEVLDQYPELKKEQEQAMPEPSKEPVKTGEIDPNQRYRIGSSPQPYQLLERLETSEIERENSEQPVRIKNMQTGKEETALESQLQPIRTLSAGERKASKGISKKQLDDALRKAGLDPDVFKTIGQKKAALRREQQKLHGPGSPSIQQGPDPKEEIQQLEEAFRNIEGKKVSPLERAQMAWDEGVKRLAAGKDDVAQALAGLKTVGDRVIRSWKGYNLLDDLLKAKGELSATIESRGWLNRKFSERVKKQFPDPKERAAIRKYVDAGGDTSKLTEGFTEAPQQYKQAYQDAMNLSPDAKVAAENIRSYFESRLQEAIDYGVLKDGVEDFIHRIYERDPKMAQKMVGYSQSALLKTNPRLALKRVFQNDWEAEKLGYKVVQDFLPAITEYETSLSKAIAARSFIKRINELKAPDGRPVIAVKGVGVPITDPNGIRQNTIIKPHSTPGKNNDPAQPLKYRGDYVERPEYGALRQWKWLGKDSAGKPIFMQGDAAIHPDFVGRVDKLLKPSELRYSKHPGIAAGSKLALGLSSAIKQTMLDFSGFHQVQIAVHGLEHRVQPGSLTIPKTGISIPLPRIPGFTKVMRDIDLTDEDTQGLLRGGVTLGGEYRSSAISEGLVGRSISRAIPGVADVMSTYHSWLFQDFIPRVKMTMAKEAFGRNMQRFKKEILSGKMSKDDMYFETAKQANAAFGELNYTMLERSKTVQDLARLTLLAPDFLEARGKFVTQAFAKHGNEQRAALFFGAVTLWTVARALNLGISGQMHNERENLFSVVYKNKSYSLRTVQGDVLHMLDNPLQFWMSRLNPVFGRTALETATGRDYFGRKRSFAEQAWDFVSTAIPVSLRTSSERKMWESLMNGMGVNARRWSDTDDAFKLAQKWKSKNGVKSKGEFIYDPDKDDLRKLKIALSNSDEGGATREIKKLIESKKYTTGKLNDYFNRYSSMPFTGSFSNDKKFEASLSDDEKTTVRAAKDHKKAMKALYQSARDKHRSALSEPSSESAP